MGEVEGKGEGKEKGEGELYTILILPQGHLAVTTLEQAVYNVRPTERDRKNKTVKSE